ncbi:DUF3592 domain-containing protein [Maribacter sp. ANRC-HE7]|uniref:DUF3592 domain-containing protein n=1 Tax=Maribacter aquimaris TaxID=2737171 RepID=A0ABR7V5P8_9FLAO|nr:DUF3592 domain-containing protein [Maribacter aquimaris]MBD0779285.1 DUF3592 domain-containing protein [Maribacter aquimaris]
MEYLASLSQFEIAGLVLQLVLLPFLFMTLRRWWWAKQSLQWPKVNGVVIKGLDFPLPKIIEFQYTYDINGTTYQGEKPFFANSFKHLSQKKASYLMDTYTIGKQLKVFYNPSNPRISTLEPGRKDGVMGVLVLLVVLFLLGAVAFYRPSLIVETMDYFSNR